MKAAQTLYVIGQLERGGAEQQLYYLLGNLKHEAAVVSMYSGGYWAEPLRKLGYPVLELDSKRRFELKRLRKILEAIRSRGPDLIHIFHTGMHGLYGQIAAKIAGHRRVIVNVRGAPSSYPPAYRAIWRKLNQDALALVCNNRAAYQSMLEMEMAPKEKLHLIRNGIDPERFRTSSADNFPWPSAWRGKNVVAMVARLEEVKNPMMFVHLAERVRKQYADARFALVGNGQMRTRIEEAVQLMGLHDVLLVLGERLDVPALLQAADLCVLTSRFEGSPNALAEAMACGLPCVTTDVGGCNEMVIDGTTGFLTIPGDLNSMTNRVLYLLREKAVRLEMGGKARLRLQQQFGLGTMIQRYSALYQLART